MKGLMIVLALGVTTSMLAQNNSSFRGDFDAFKKDARKEYSDFRKQCMKEYADFVRTAWKEFRPEKAVPIPHEEEVTPILVPDADEKTASWFSNLYGAVKRKLFKKKGNDTIKISQKNKKEEVEPQSLTKKDSKPAILPFKEVIAAAPKVEQPQPLSEVIEQRAAANEYQSFTIFGTTYRIRVGDNCRFTLKSVQPDDVADVWTLFTQTQFDNMLYDCLQERKQHHLSDWAYYKMLEGLTDAFYGKKSNEAALVMAFLYSQSGYKMRLAHDDSRLYMLAATRHFILGRSYYYIGGDDYFLLGDDKCNTLKICEKAKFPKEGALSLQMDVIQDFNANPTQSRTITSQVDEDFSFTLTSNKNYIDFYSTYPVSTVNGNFMTRWAMIANTPLEKGITEQLYPKMREKLQGLSELDAAQQLHWWLQSGFKYMLDKDAWGVDDRIFFGEETLFYPACDCEDRAILLSHLVRDLLGLKVVLVYYPGHLSMAINFKEDVKGDAFIVDGQRFVVCDPTYIGSRVGQTADVFNNAEASVILLD